ncbi:MAG: MFS transporter [Desulfuromonadales bacterium]|nr:MFS transporter [Desulfuromonadales bacterium]
MAMRDRQRWLIFGVLALMYILVYFYRISLAVVAGDLSRDLQLSPQQLGTLSSVLFYVYAVAQLPLGPMIDRIGGRLVISAFGVLTSIGGILFSQADSLAVAMAARVLIGIGTASVLMATLTIFSHWFSKQHFGKVSSYMVAVGNLGNLCATAPLALAVAAIGWRASFLVIGVIQVLVTILVFVSVRDRPTGIPSGSEEGQKKLVEPVGMLAAWKEIFGNRDFRLLGVISFAWYGNYLALQGLWGGPYLMQVLHLTRQATGRMLMFTSLGFIAGSLVNDSIARRFFRSYKKTLLAGQILLLTLMTIFLLLAQVISHSLLALLFFAIGLAVSSGVMIYPIIRSMFPLRIVGTALTSLNYCVLLGAAVTQQVMGLIVGSFTPLAMGAPPQAFRAAFCFPVIGLAMAIVMFLFARDYSDMGRE